MTEEFERLCEEAYSYAGKDSIFTWTDLSEDSRQAHKSFAEYIRRRVLQQYANTLFSMEIKEDNSYEFNLLMNQEEAAQLYEVFGSERHIVGRILQYRDNTLRREERQNFKYLSHLLSFQIIAKSLANDGITHAVKRTLSNSLINAIDELIKIVKKDYEVLLSKKPTPLFNEGIDEDDLLF